MIETPDWIQLIIEAHDGGWAVPIHVRLDHPLVVDKWRCMYCDKVFNAASVVVVMPLMDKNPHWVATHRHCLLKRIIPQEG